MLDQLNPGDVRFVAVANLYTAGQDVYYLHPNTIFGVTPEDLYVRGNLDPRWPVVQVVCQPNGALWCQAPPAGIVLQEAWDWVLRDGVQVVLCS